MRFREILKELVNAEQFAPGFERTGTLLNDRYKITVHCDPKRAGEMASRGQMKIYVKVTDPQSETPNTSIAWATFNTHNRYFFWKDLQADMVSVHPAYQKQGIATAMYKFVATLGNTIKPSDFQLPPGKALWQSINRNKEL